MNVIERVRSLDTAPTDDSAPISPLPWLTPRRAIFFVVGWLGLFALFSVLLSNPFQSEANAGATPSYANVMYLHGLLIGMVGLGALVTLSVLRLRSAHVRAWIVGGVVVATVLASIGGIFDVRIPGAEVPMWTQIAGFFALDEILVTLMIGIWLARAESRELGRLPFVAAFAAAAAMLGAAVMGHLAGWLMEFGEGVPAALANYRQWAGFGKADDFVGALVGSHSHEMAVGAMALAVTLLVTGLGYGAAQGAARLVARIGLGFVATGTVLMALFYLVTGFGTWAPPQAIAQVGGDPNVIPLDDLITGILVMGGGVVATLGLIARWIKVPTRLAAAWSFALAVGTVAVAGYTIELNTSFFGAGDPKAAGAAADGIFTWLHQDLGLFLLPTLVLVLIAADRLIPHRVQRDVIGVTAFCGASLLFAGGMIWVFVDPALYGAGYLISALGAVVTGIAVLAAVWYGGIAELVERRRHVLVHAAGLGG